MTTEQVFLTGDALSFNPHDFSGFATLIVDPPYSDYVHKHMASHGTEGRGSRPREAGFESLSNELRGHISKIMHRVSRWSVVFTDHESTHLWRADVQIAGADYLREKTSITVSEYEEDIRWIRWSQPQLSGDRPAQTSESVLHFHRNGPKHWNGPGSLTHYRNRCLRGADKHPTEKPLDLILNLVSFYSDPGESVVDVCAGSGTTALAAKLLGRDALCIEFDPKWKAVADRRLALDWIPRDRERAEEWCVTTTEEASTVPKPKAADGSDVKTWERAQRRLADVKRVIAWL